MDLFHVPNPEVFHAVFAAVGFEMGSERRTVAVVKDTYNTVFREALSRLHKALRARDPAAWTHAALVQLVQWTFVFRGMAPPNIPQVQTHYSGPARYGWRYVIDTSLRAAATPPSLYLGKPSEIEVWDIFSLLIVLHVCTEQSNLLHYFKDDFTSARLVHDDPITALTLILDEREDGLFRDRIAYLGGRPVLHDSSPLHPKIVAEPYSSLLDPAFRRSLGFSIKSLKPVFDALIEISYPVPTIAHSYAYLSNWVADIARIPVHEASAALDFMLLTPSKLSSTPRSFTRRNDGARMLYFAGVVVPRPAHLDVLYSPESVTADISRDHRHVIVSVPLAAECIDNTEMIIYGTRPDLKTIPGLLPAIEKAQLHYHRDVFQRHIADHYETRGWSTHCSVEKLGADELPCGEIDIIALSPTRDRVDVIEAKAVAGISSARAWAQAQKDFFEQKRYHQKFLRKIDYVRGNIANVLTALTPHHLGDLPDFGTLPIRGRMVTRHPHPAKFTVTEYDVISFDDLVAEDSV